MSTPIKPDSKTAKKRSQWPRVRWVEGRRRSWMVDARLRGKGERFFYETPTEADTKADQLRIGRNNTGTDGAAMPARLRIEAADCAARLARLGATLTEATDFFILHARPASGARTVESVIKDFLREKEKAGRRPEYLRVQRHVLTNFANAFPGREVHTITNIEIGEWMDAQSWTLRTRENYRRDLSKLFRFAIKHTFCAGNPMAKMEKATLDEKPPGIVTLHQASALLNAAAQTEDGVLVPYVAIALFAGLRTSELLSLDWQQVSIADRTIEVQSHKAKGRARRIVTMSENLKTWLTTCAKTTGPVVPPEGFRGMWKRVREIAKVKWDRNALRHTFASCHVAAHKNAPATSLEMGHDNPEQLFASYRSLVRPSDAAKFWKLKPTKEGKVVSIAAA